MPETYALHEGAFGRAVVLELRDDLVAHAHAETQLALWLGGAACRQRAAVLLRGAGHSDRRGGPAKLLERARQDRVAAAAPDADIDGDVERLLLAAIDSSQALVKADGLTPTAPVLDHRPRAAIAYMREHASEATADEVAARVGLSRGHFFALFRDQLNTTPQVFLSAVRFEEAVRRLVQQEEPLTSVALDLGFSTPGNFSRFFRDHMGVSPSRFRRAATRTTPNLLTGVA